MKLADRVSAFSAAFAKWPSSWPYLVKEGGRDVLYATWCIGQDYRNKTTYYGAYPNGYLARVMALFPDAAPNVLHVFSGSLPSGPYVRVDVNPACKPDYVGTVYNLPSTFPAAERSRAAGFALTLADPPYSADDAARYGTKMIDRRRAIASIGRITRNGGHLVWLDTVWPMHRKTEWRTVGRITVIRSTNHRVRLVSIFERTTS